LNDTSLYYIILYYIIVSLKINKNLLINLPDNEVAS